MFDFKNRWKKKKQNQKVGKVWVKTSKQKYISLKRFEFQENFMIETSMIKLTQFKKTGSMGQNFNSAPKIKIYIRSQN